MEREMNVTIAEVSARSNLRPSSLAPNHSPSSLAVLQLRPETRGGPEGT